MLSSLLRSPQAVKDLGKKWFAVTLMTEYTANELLDRL